MFIESMTWRKVKHLSLMLYAIPLNFILVSKNMKTSITYDGIAITKLSQGYSDYTTTLRLDIDNMPDKCRMLCFRMMNDVPPATIAQYELLSLHRNDNLLFVFTSRFSSCIWANCYWKKRLKLNVFCYTRYKLCGL